MRLIKLLFVAALLVLCGNLSANHVLGGNISYECLGGNNYGITLTLYVDCFGVTPAPAQENIFFFPNSGCALPFSASFPLQSVTEVSDLCASELVNSSCNGGFNPGVQEITYYDEVILNDACQWNLNYGSGDWNYFLNMDNGMLPTAYIATTIDPTVVGCVDSVVPANPIPVNYSCTEDDVVYDLAIDNPNGYDLTYTFVCPQTTDGVDAPMTEPCDELIPGIAIDPVTGEITFTSPNMFGNYSVAVQIDMFDGADYIGTITQSLAFVVRLCDDTPTVFESPLVNFVDGTGTIISDNEVQACVGDSLCFSVEASNGNIFRSIELASDFTTFFPDATFTQTGSNPAVGIFCILVDENMVGSTVFTVSAEDDACLNPTFIESDITLTVLPAAVVNIDDAVICFGETINLEAFGDNGFQWNAFSGDLNPGFVGNSPTQSISPTEDTEIEVVPINADPACPSADTLFIAVSLSGFDAQIVDESCAQNDGSIDLTVSGGSGNYSYDWPDIPFDGPNPTGLTGGDYTVIVSDDDLAGCERTETYTVETTPPPSGSISGDITICEGDCADILFTLNGTGQFTVELLNETTGSLETTAALNDQDSFQVCPDVTTTYTLQLVTDGNAPACTFDTPSSVTITVRPELNAGFLQPDAICAGEDAVLELSIDQAGSYDIEYLPGGGVPASPGIFSDGDVVTFDQATAGMYEVISVNYSDAPACPGIALAAVELIVNDLPTAVVSDDITICEGEEVNIDITLTGTGPWELGHDFAGLPSPLVINTSPFEWPVGNLTSSVTISFDTLLDQGTGCSADVDQSTAITVNPLPEGNILDDATLCFDEDYNLIFDLTGTGPFNIEWSDGTNTFNDNGVPAGFEVNVNPTGNTEYCLESLEDALGCVSSPDVCVELTEIPAATAAFVGLSDDICLGDCYDIAFDFNNATGPFELTIELTDIDGTITESFVLNDGESLNFCPDENLELVLTEVIDQATGCAADLSGAVPFNIAVSTISYASIVGDADLCAGECVDVEIEFTDAVGPLDFTFDGVNYSDIDTGVDLVDGIFTAEVCPANTGDFILSDYTDQGNVCAEIDNNIATLTISPLPEATLNNDVAICEGEDANLVFQVNATGPVDIELEVSNGVDADELLTISGVEDGDPYIVNPTITTEYTILEVLDPNTPTSCSVEPLTVTTVTVATAPEVSLQDTLCAPTALTFQYSFVISGGTPGTYTVDVPGTLEDFGGGPDQLYTSDPLTPQDGAVFNITDFYDCGPIAITIDPFDCPILTFAGTVNLDAQALCEDDLLEIVHNGDEILDPNDVLSFIIHSEPGPDLGTVYYISDTPVWDIANDLDFAGTLDYGVTYYVSAVAGDDDGSGVVDLGSAVLDVSEGTPFTVLQAPEASLSGGGDICEGEIAEITIDFTGDGPFSVAWAIDGFESPDSPITDTIDNPLTIESGEAGTYSLISVFNAGCAGEVNGNAEIIVSPLPEATISGGGTLCEGGEIDLELSLAGTADWDVILANDVDGDGTADNTEVLTFSDAVNTMSVEEAGNWYIESVTDATGCTNDNATAPVVVTVVPLPTATFAFGDSSYCEGNTVTIELELTGSAPFALDYGVDGAPFNEIIADDFLNFDVSTGGFVCLSTLTDDNGCLATLNDCIELTLLPIPEALTGGDATICVGENITLGDAPVGGYTYSWSNADLLIGADAANPTFQGPESDQTEEYTFELTVEADGCEASEEVTITVEPLPIASAGDALFICEGDDAVLQATGGMSYLWTDNGTFDQGGLDTASPTVSPTETIDYEVTVTDANNCSATAVTTVSVNEAISATVEFTDELCFEVCNGSIDIVPEGGYGTYIVTWDDPQLTGANPEDLCAGDYSFTITDAEECSFTDEVNITELPEYFIEDVEITDVTCSGGSDGSLTVLSGQAVEFTIENVSESNDSGIFNGLPAGLYDISVSDASGCIADTTVSIGAISDPLEIELDIASSTVCVDEVLTLEADAQGGSGVLEYFWFSEDNSINSTDNPITFTPEDDIDLFVYALDDLGCSTDTLLSAVNFSTPIDLEVAPSTVIEICEEECVDLFADASGGIGELEYEWVATTFDNEVVGTTPNVNLCPPSINLVEYTVTVSDGCTFPVSETVMVTIFDVPIPVMEIDTLQGCFPLTVTFVNLTDESFLGDCEWDFGDGNTAAVCDTVEYTYGTPGIYEPSLSVVAPNGCSGTGVSDVPITVSDYPDADFTWTPDEISTLDGRVSFTNLTTGAIEYEWTFVGIDESTEENPSFEFPAADGVSWDVCLLALNEFGCADSICYTIDMVSEILVYVPSAFTPDNDGLNELFMPVVGGGVSTEEFLFTVWDRWGKKVFETNRIGEGWNGSVDRGSYYTQHDAYVWVVQFKDIQSGDKRELKGHVILLR